MKDAQGQERVHELAKPLPALPFLSRPCLMLVTEPMERGRLLAIVHAAVLGGVNIVQIRDKAAGIHEVQDTAAALQSCVPQARILVNGCLGEGLGAAVSGIHLGEQGGNLVQARGIVGAHGLVGRSVHSLAGAHQAQREGADYLIAGTIFASASHPNIAPAGLEFLEQVCGAVSLPVIAIGGITPERATLCLDAGAAGVAVLSSIMRAADPFASARQYRLALDVWQRSGEKDCIRRVLMSDTSIELTVNGEARLLAHPMRLSEFLSAHGLQEKMVVVERNRTIVPRPQYAEVLLQRGDELEIVQMMAGG